MKKSYLVLLLAGVLSLASCSWNKKNNNTSTTGSVSVVSLSQETMDVQVGKRSSDVTVTLTGEGDFNKGVKLVSENDAIAAASFTEISDGETFKVYGKAVGDTKINVISMADETKAASLSVSVKAKEITVLSEIQSVSLDRETKLFKLSDAAINVAVTVNGRGTFDNTATISLSENPTVTVDKTTVADGQSFAVAPASLGETTIKVTSVQDSTKYAELVVRVEEDAPVVPPQTIVVQLDCVSHTLVEGGSDFVVSAYAQGGEIDWDWKEEDAETYVHLGDHDNTHAVVSPVAATPDEKTATLVASIGDVKAECVFKVNERPKEFHTYYVSNNSFLGYDDVYFYTWNEYNDENAAWPGVKLSDPVQNTNGEDCYPFTVDVLKYTNFKFNNGKQDADAKETEAGTYASFGANNNVWFNDEGIHFAVLELDEPTIRFANRNVTVYSGEQETFSFVCRKGNAAAEVISGEDNVSVVDVSNGSITVHGDAVGTATVKVYIPGANPEDPNLAEDLLYVEVLDSSNVETFYFTNNKGWENVYLYTWNTNNEHNQEWPGVQLYNPVKNNYNQDAYVIHMNMARWNYMILNNGAGEQTEDIDLAREEFATNDNIYPASAESPYDIGFANFTGLTYSVEFELDEINVYSDKNAHARVNAVGAGVTYNVTEGIDKVEIVKYEDSYVNLKYLAAGDATITATLHGVTDTLTVHCIAASAPDTSETLYFSNNKGWTSVYLYAWNENGYNHDWPGVEVPYTDLVNELSEPVYEFSIDPEVYSSIILNNGAGTQTRDISLTEEGFATNNNIYPTELNAQGKFDIGFAVFDPTPHVHNYDSTTHQCECGEYDPTYEELITVRLTDNYGLGQPRVKQWKASDGDHDYTSNLITPSSSYINEFGQTVYAFSVDKFFHDTISFVDAAGSHYRTVDIDISGITDDVHAWYLDGQTDGVFAVGTWTYVATRNVYLKVGLWSANDPVYFIWYWGNDIEGVAAQLELVSGTGENAIYRVSIPVQALYMKFVRMPNGATELDWNTKWNETGEIHFDGDSTSQYNITDWSAGEWVAYAG